MTEKCLQNFVRQMKFLQEKARILIILKSRKAITKIFISSLVVFFKFMMQYKKKWLQNVIKIQELEKFAKILFSNFACVKKSATIYEVGRLKEQKNISFLG